MAATLDPSHALTGILPPPAIVEPTTLVAEMVTLMQAEGGALTPFRTNWRNQPTWEEIGYILVQQGSCLVGQITALDIVRSHLQSPLPQRAEEIMNPTLVTLTPEQWHDPHLVLALYHQHQVDRLPVLDTDHQVIGQVTASSLLQVLQQTHQLKLQHVSDVMLTQVPMALPQASLQQVAEIMTERRCPFVVIVQSLDAPVPMGFVTAEQLAFQSTPHGDWHQIQAETIMGRPPLEIRPADSLWFAFDEMRQREPCLLVCQPNHQLVGVVTPMHLLQSMHQTGLHRTVQHLRQTLQKMEAEKLELLQNRNAELERQVSLRTSQIEEQSLRMGEELRSSRLLAATALRIQRSLDLEEILQITVEEVRQLLQCDRTFIYRLQEDPQEVNLVESVAHANLSLQAVPHGDFHCLTQLLKSDCADGERAISDLDLARGSLDALSLLKQLQVKANLIIPLQDETLWGLLIAQHCTAPRPWQSWETSLMNQLATQVSIAIQKSALYQQLQSELAERRQAEQALKRINEDLEVRVEARTQSWRQANAQLVEEVAERKRAEAELREAKDRMQAVLDAVPGLVSWFDTDLCYLGVNHNMATTFGLEPEEFVGQEVGFLALGNEFPQLIQQLFNSEEKAISREIKEFINGTTRYYLLAAQKYNQNQAVVCIGIDTTHYRQTQAALEKSEARFQKFVEQTNDWVWEINSDLRLSYVNPQVTNILGYEASDLLNKQFIDFMTEDESIRFSTILHHATVERQPFSQLEQTLQHQKGQPIYLELSGTPIFTSDGEWQGYWGISRNITERKQIELKIRRALTKERELSELKTRFISMASHEFRTPLTTIMASAESLEHYRHRWNETKIVAYLQRIQKTAIHMNGLLNDVLTVGRANSVQLACNPAPLLLQGFCQDLIGELELGARTPGRIQFTYRGPATLVQADEKLLRQILGNLLSNALKYAIPDTRPELTVTVSAKETLVVIQDEGIGIPEKDLLHLFEPFHRADNVGTIQGTGLGLAIVKKSVDAHGGTIQVESQEGVGTVFRVLLPLQSVDVDHD